MRQQDISLWQEADIQTVNKRGRKRYHKRKSAITAYFTSNRSIEEIASEHHLSPQQLLDLAEQCLALHEDGTPQGFRALTATTEPTSHTSHTQESPPDNSQESITSTDNDPVSSSTNHVATELPLEIEAIPCDETEEDTELTQKKPAILLHDTTNPTITDIVESVADASPERRDEPESLAEVAIEEQIDEPDGAEREEDEPVEQEEISSEFVQTDNSDEADEKEEVTVVTIASEETPNDNNEPILAVASVEADLPILEEAESSVSETPEQAAASSTGSMLGKSGFSFPTFPSRYVKRKRSTSTDKKHSAHLGHLLYKRGQRTSKHKGKRNLQRTVSIALLVAILLGTLIPLGVGLTAYNLYNSVSNLAHDGVNNLLAVKTLLPISKDDPTAVLNPAKLQQAQKDFASAEDDFTQLQQMVDRPDVQAAVAQFSPDYSHKLISARHLIQVALDVSQMGQEVSNVGIIAANIIHGSPLADSSTKPLVSVSDISAIQGALVHALYYIDDIQSNMGQVNLKDIPISDKQKAQLVGLLALLPKAHDMILQAQELVPPIAWLLGVGQQRNFLVQTMDSGELRPSGGFTGQYGLLQIQDGRMAPFNLRDVALLDYAGNGMELGRSAPAAYSSWMNFGNWGLRDSNLSADYPTTAQMSMRVFEEEGGGPVDGDISFTPTFIGHILDVTGPLRNSEYNETITSKNLEDRQHYYQQDYNAIALQREKTGDNSHAVRKAFTSLVGKTLLDRIRHLPTSQLITIIKGAAKDLQSRDLEIYFTDPTAEQWLVDHGYSGAMNTFNKQDGFMVVQANISISKASQYVHTTEHDDVVIDAQGGATHSLTITLDYRQTGQVYGFDTYADYIRVYVPQSAQFISGDGFDTHQPLCVPPAQPVSGNGGKGGTGNDPKGNGGNSPPPKNDCAQYNTFFPSSARYCPSGNYSLGERLFHEAWPIDRLGQPTSLTSDLPGRAMWGGLTETPKNCTSYISLSWYVPHAVKQVAGKPVYTLQVDKQGGYVPTVELTVNTDALKQLKPWKINSDLVADTVYSH